MTALIIHLTVASPPLPGNGNPTITFTPVGDVIETGENSYLTETGPLPAGLTLGSVAVDPPDVPLQLDDGRFTLYANLGQQGSWWLGTAVALPEGVYDIAVAAEGSEPAPGPGTGMLATISFANGTFSYDEADGAPFSNWVDARGRFTQLRTRVANPEVPNFWVDFVRDTEGDWASVEFRHGTAGQTPVVNTGPCSVTVTGDFEGQASTPDHWWGARWRMSGNKANGLRPGGNDWPWPMTDYATLLADRLIPEYDPRETGVPSTVSPTLWREVAPYTPMGSSSYTTSMGTGGGRPDIGLFTDWDGAALAAMSPNAGPDLAVLVPQLLANVRTLAEAAASIPQGPMEPGTSHIYVQTPGQPLLGGEAPAPCPWRIDTPHMPEIGYVAFILWGDPYDLDTCQRGGGMAMYYYGSNYQIFQTRQQAWDYRGALLAWVATPDNAPDWLLPRSRFETWINTIQDFVIANCIDGAAVPDGGPLSTVFHAIEATNASNGYDVRDTAGNVVIWQGSIIMPWQNAYCAQAAAFGVWLRPTDAKAARLAVFSLTHLKEQSDGQSGWPPGALPVYYLPVAKQAGAPFFTSWGECWAYWCQILGNTNPDGSINPIPPGYVCADAPATPQVRPENADYPNQFWCALSLAAQAGILGFHEARDWWAGPCKAAAYIEQSRALLQV